MINFDERRRYGLYLYIERESNPDHCIPQSYKYELDELPVSFQCKCVDRNFAERIDEWCNLHLTGEWERNTMGGDTMPVYGKWVFWNKEDAVTFKMYWGNYQEEWNFKGL